MTVRALLAPALLTLSLAACAEPPAGPPSAAPPPADADLCRASAYQGLVGQPKSVLSTMMLPAGSRVIGPGDAVTMDFRPDRLNIEVGTSGRVEKIGCY